MPLRRLLLLGFGPFQRPNLQTVDARSRRSRKVTPMVIERWDELAGPIGELFSSDRTAHHRIAALLLHFRWQQPNAVTPDCKSSRRPCQLNFDGRDLTVKRYLGGDP